MKRGFYSLFFLINGFLWIIDEKTTYYTKKFIDNR